MHAARVLSLGSAVVGVVHAALLAIHAIGQAYAQSAGITAKIGVKQVDRLVSNRGLCVDELTRTWAQFVVSGRTELLFAMDDHSRARGSVPTPWCDMRGCIRA